MPQSLADVLVHLVYSTKTRMPVVTPTIREELNPYVSGVLRNHNCNPIAIGGVEDHMHVLFALSRTITIARLVEKLKTSSNKWANDKWHCGLEWQSGYGAFSVGRQELNVVKDYIWHQAEHHKTVSFQDEFRKLLTEHEVQFDERYVWD